MLVQAVVRRAIAGLQGGIFFCTRNDEFDFDLLFPDEKELIELVFYSGIVALSRQLSSHTTSMSTSGSSTQTSTTRPQLQCC